MRRSIFAWSAVAVAAIATLSCQKEANIKTPDIEEGVTINVIADNIVTKTAAVDGDTPTIQWSEGDKIKIYEIVDDAVGASATSAEAVINSGKASFTATLSGSPQGASFKYSAVYPASAVDQGGSGENKFYRIKMPKDQTLKGNNFSEDSDLMFSTVLDHGDSRVANNESVQFSFRRLGTVVRLQLVGITAGEKIKKVTLTAPVNMAGRVKYDPVTGTISDAFYDSSSNSSVITLTVSDELVATGNDVVWFRVIAERDWGEENDKIGVEVETDQANYYRNGLDSEHALIASPVIKFKDGGLTKFGFNLANYRVAKSAATVFTKVNDASEISAGGEYLVTAVKSDKTYAMGSYTDANNPYYSPVEVPENEGTIGITSEPVTSITLEDAGDGSFYIKVPGETSDQYLYWIAGNSVGRADKGGDSFKWTVTPTSIINVGNSERMLQFNSTSPRFACYTTNQTAIQLYANLATVTPVPTNSITLEDVAEGNKIYLDAVDGVASFTVTTDDNWTANVNIENGDFSIDPENGAEGSTEIVVSADEDNTGAERQMGTITITCGNATKTVYVIQEAGESGSDGDGLTPDTAFNTTGVAAYIDGNGADNVYVKGIISRIIYEYDADHTTATFYISDDGSETNEFEAYKVFYLGNTRWQTGDTQIAVGDNVILYGKVTKYQTTYETSANNAYLYSLNGEVYPTITVSDISGIDAAGVTNATTPVTFADNAGWTASVTADGTVVTAASINGSTITYTVSENTGNSRTGKITVSLSKGERTISAEINVSQLPGTSGGTDYSITNTSNVELTTTGGTSASTAKVKIGGVDYDAIKAGTSKQAGAVLVTVPSGATKLYMHVAAWNGETVTLGVTPAANVSKINDAATTSMSLTADSGISGSSTTYTLNAPDKVTTDYFFTIDLTDITGDTALTFTATSGKRFVIWGVNTD